MCQLGCAFGLGAVPAPLQSHVSDMGQLSLPGFLPVVLKHCCGAGLCACGITSGRGLACVDVDRELDRARAPSSVVMGLSADRLSETLIGECRSVQMVNGRRVCPD